MTMTARERVLAALKRRRYADRKRVEDEKIF